MSLMLFRGCASLIIGGFAIGAPTYLYSQWNGSSLTNQAENRNVRSSTPLYTLSGQPARETVSVTQEQLLQEQQFDNCMTGDKLNSRVTKVGNPSETKIVSISEVSQYLDKPDEWKVESLYENQCKKSDQ